MKTLIPMSIVLHLVVSMVLATSLVGVSYGAGGDMGADTEPLTNGSADYPYLIEDMADFDVFAGDSSYWAGGVHTKLTCDPNLAGRPYTTAVVAPDGSCFEGVFDGNGHIIRNLTIDTAGDPNDYLGLFGYISGSGAKVKNLGIENINITGGDNFFGGLCGRNGHWPNPGGTITNCYATGSVTGGDNSKYLGGLCGVNDNGTITNCYATGAVTGGDNSACLGGLCGRNYHGTITNCYATGSVTGRDYSDHLGGLCGVNGYWDNSGDTISNCYATGAVTGVEYLGGLCGENYGIISNCYATGAVTGVEYLGGLCGWNYRTITSCFWDVETGGPDNGVGTPKTTAQMQTENTFTDVGWVFADYQTGLRGWYMPAGGYPLMYWQNPGAAAIPDVTNMTLSEMQGALTDAGLTLGNVFYINSWQIPEDVVTGLSAYIGGYVDTSYPVDIYISAGSSGDGSQANPYEIACQADLDAVNNNLSMHYIMTADIYLGYHVTYTTAVIAPDTSINFGFQGTSFTGTFDGDSHIVSNLTIDAKDTYNDYLGLFGRIDDPDMGVKNLSLENVNIIGGNGSWYLGGLCGYNGYGTITNCYATGSVIGRYHLGGLCGWNGEGTITNCYATGAVTGGDDSDYLGGLCGWNNGGTIINCYATGSVTGDDNLGGLCGCNDYVGTITNCYATGAVTGGDDSDYLGGLCGKNYSAIANCYATGSVTGGDNSARLGGLCGNNDHGTITNCYATGSVIGGDYSRYLGGLCGYNYNNGTITNCYSTGSVIGYNYLGGLCGKNSDGTITNCFWDVETSGIGIEGDDNYGATGKTTEQMQTQSTFTDANWDFTVMPVWHMPFEVVGYPMLGWQKDIPGDFVGSYGVGMDDWAILADAWLSDDTPSVNWNENCDLDGNGEIGVGDMKMFAECWLAGKM